MVRKLRIQRIPFPIQNQEVPDLMCSSGVCQIRWERNLGFGIGAQIDVMAGMLALAVNEKRILARNYSNQADHEGCVGTFYLLRWDVKYQNCTFFI